MRKVVEALRLRFEQRLSQRSGRSGSLVNASVMIASVVSLDLFVRLTAISLESTRPSRWIIDGVLYMHAVPLTSFDFPMLPVRATVESAFFVEALGFITVLALRHEAARLGRSIAWLLLLSGLVSDLLFMTLMGRGPLSALRLCAGAARCGDNSFSIADMALWSGVVLLAAERRCSRTWTIAVTPLLIRSGSHFQRLAIAFTGRLTRISRRVSQTRYLIGTNSALLVVGAGTVAGVAALGSLTPQGLSSLRLAAAMHRISERQRIASVCNRFASQRENMVHDLAAQVLSVDVRASSIGLPVYTTYACTFDSRLLAARHSELAALGAAPYVSLVMNFPDASDARRAVSALRDREPLAAGWHLVRISIQPVELQTPLDHDALLVLPSESLGVAPARRLLLMFASARQPGLAVRTVGMMPTQWRPIASASLASVLGRDSVALIDARRNSESISIRSGFGGRIGVRESTRLMHDASIASASYRDALGVAWKTLALVMLAHLLVVIGLLQLVFVGRSRTAPKRRTYPALGTSAICAVLMALGTILFYLVSKDALSVLDALVGPLSPIARLGPALVMASVLILGLFGVFGSRVATSARCTSEVTDRLATGSARK